MRVRRIGRQLIFVLALVFALLWVLDRVRIIIFAHLSFIELGLFVLFLAGVLFLVLDLILDRLGL